MKRFVMLLCSNAPLFTVLLLLALLPAWSVEAQSLFCGDGSETFPDEELYQAAERGDSEGVKRLIDEFDIQDSETICRTIGRDIHCRPTPLHLAVRSGRIDAVRILLEKGANVDAKFSVGLEELAQVIGIEDPVQVYQVLGCIKGIGTPLWWAIKFMKTPTGVIELLLTNGADPNAPNAVQALRLAAGFGDVNAVRLLLANGAEPNPKSSPSPLHAAIGGMDTARIPGVPPEVVPEYYYKVIELLLESGADLNRPDRRGITDMQYAINSGHQKVIEIIDSFCRSNPDRC